MLNHFLKWILVVLLMLVGIFVFATPFVLILAYFDAGPFKVNVKKRYKHVLDILTYIPWWRKKKMIGSLTILVLPETFLDDFRDKHENEHPW